MSNSCLEGESESINAGAFAFKRSKHSGCNQDAIKKYSRCIHEAIKGGQSRLSGIDQDWKRFGTFQSGSERYHKHSSGYARPFDRMPVGYTLGHSLCRVVSCDLQECTHSDLETASCESHSPMPISFAGTGSHVCEPIQSTSIASLAWLGCDRHAPCTT